MISLFTVKYKNPMSEDLGLTFSFLLTATVASGYPKSLATILTSKPWGKLPYRHFLILPHNLAAVF